MAGVSFRNLQLSHETLQESTYVDTVCTALWKTEFQKMQFIGKIWTKKVVFINDKIESILLFFYLWIVLLKDYIVIK